VIAVMCFLWLGISVGGGRQLCFFEGSTLVVLRREENSCWLFVFIIVRVSIE